MPPAKKAAPTTGKKDNVVARVTLKHVAAQPAEDREMPKKQTEALLGVQAGSEATRRPREQGQTFGDALAEWNSAISEFVSHRMARNTEAFTRLAKCQGFPDAFAIQAQWIQNTTDDYSKEIQKLMGVNGRITTQLSGSSRHPRAAV